MKKVRVYEAAREFKISSEALLEIIRSLGIPVKSHMSSVTDDVVDKIREKIQKTREHTARLLKKLFDKGFIDRNTRSMPYRYHLRKEIVDLVKNHQARNEINL